MQTDDSHALSGSLDTSLFANFVGQSGEMTAILKQLFPDVAPCNLNHKSRTVSRRLRHVHRHWSGTDWISLHVYETAKTKREKNEVRSFCHLTWTTGLKTSNIHHDILLISRLVLMLQYIITIDHRIHTRDLYVHEIMILKLTVLSYLLLLFSSYPSNIWG